MTNQTATDVFLKMYFKLEQRREALHAFVAARIIEWEVSGYDKRSESHHYCSLRKRAVERAISDHNFIWNAVGEETLKWDINGDDDDHHHHNDKTWDDEL